MIPFLISRTFWSILLTVSIYIALCAQQWVKHGFKKINRNKKTPHTTELLCRLIIGAEFVSGVLDGCFRNPSRLSLCKGHIPPFTKKETLASIHGVHHLKPILLAAWIHFRTPQWLQLGLPGHSQASLQQTFPHKFQRSLC